ncbi:glutathione S-transferase N-terminal domain-containing protein [Lentisphaera marina]|uniref:glutaredoxin family protein n=1 Tax=Lentisphaera marina TaxID=1111041 RepID=UPI0023658AA4|nr:glutathione S-transferase N-terminal domain-containing protein [Lentisphaera marina]MDD7983667.1 glutathione S-transferase N-terminal domain-containing protein [Lentisphaera marina]
MPELKLYSSNGCPFCRKVTSFMSANGIKVDIEDPFSSNDAMFAFKGLTGKTQVPCLIIDGKPMHESDDIIQWMKENLA